MKPEQNKKIGAPKPAVTPDRQKVDAPPEPVSPERKRRWWPIRRKKAPKP